MNAHQQMEQLARELPDELADLKRRDPEKYEAFCLEFAALLEEINGILNDADQRPTEAN